MTDWKKEEGFDCSEIGEWNYEQNSGKFDVSRKCQSLSKAWLLLLDKDCLFVCFF